MDLPESPYVNLLKYAENFFLQVLIPEFRLTRTGQGATRGSRLELRIDENLQAIWSNMGKKHLRSRMSRLPDQVSLHQEALDSYLIDRREAQPLDISGLRYRYGSGGTLPVVSMGTEEYYCLFYREIHPIGWNIANGGCDSREELLRPFEAVDRELREELIILNPARKRRYVFQSDLENPLERQEFMIVRQALAEKYPGLQIDRMQEWPLPVKWLDGVDELTVHMGARSETTRNCFLNINAADFGIEIDRVAWISIDEDALLMDGEPTQTLDNKLVNAPVGLFEIDRFDEAFEANETAFLPDILFHDLERYDLRNLSTEQRQAQMDEVVAKFMNDLSTVHEEEDRTEFASFSEKQNLCPVTRAIVRRYIDTMSPRSDVDLRKYDVFISCSSEDANVARRLYDAMKRNGIEAFLSVADIHNGVYAKAIDAALNSSRHMVVVGTSIENITRRWVEYEWTRYHVAYHNGQKPGGKLIPYLDKEIIPALLPGPLAIQHVIQFNRSDPDNLPPVSLP